MENILVKLARRAKTSLHADNSIADQMRSPRSSSEYLEAKRRKISANKAMFNEIFGEEAPSWWGDFNIVKH